MAWQALDGAPKDGSPVRLVGRYQTDAREVEVTGRYEEGGYTEGWVDDRGRAFWPRFWKPFVE